MRFIADSMLGRLAKWLRVIGYDTVYFPEIPDSELVDIALKENRFILTRDTLLIKRRKVKEFLLIKNDHFRDQLYYVIKHLALDPFSGFLTRCVRCNTPLDNIDKKSVMSVVPPYVYETEERFKKCPSCNKIYWGATHKDGMERELRTIFKRIS